MPILTEEERLGTLVGNRYRLVAEHGRTATGVTYEALEVTTDARVAVHVLSAAFTNDEDTVARFLREAKAAAELRHPHIASVYALGADDPHTVWIAREWLDGETLAAFVARRERLSPREAVELLWPILVALEAAHSQGIVHRAIEPTSVFLRVDGEGRLVPKLLELGVAKLFEQSAASKATRAGLVVGSPHCMAPEQVLGMPTVTPALDIWALGVVMYACVAGRLPFVGDDTGAVLGAITHGDYVPLSLAVPGVESAFAEVVAKALSPLSSRYATVRQFAFGLAGALGMDGVWPVDATALTEPARIDSVPPAAVAISLPSRPVVAGVAPAASLPPPAEPVAAASVAPQALDAPVRVPEQRAMKAGVRLGKVAAVIVTLLVLVALGISGVEHLVRQGVTEALDARTAAERTHAAEAAAHVPEAAPVPVPVPVPVPEAVPSPPMPLHEKPSAPVPSSSASEAPSQHVAVTRPEPSARPARPPSPSRSHAKISNLSREF